MMLKQKVTVTALAVILAFGAAPCGASEAESSGDDLEKYDLNVITCKEVMRLSGNDRDEVMTFIHGYLAGEAKLAVVDLVEMGQATDTFIERCLDKPTDKAFATMRSILAEQD